MGRRTARALHLALSTVGAALYFLFVIPRWWVLTGDIPATLAEVGRIATGFPIAAAAIPVALTLRSSLQPKERIPELALRLRAWSAALHLVAGVLIILTAVAEIWLPLHSAGPWLFGAYGAAGSVTILAVAAFALSFSAEKPPAPPKPPKPPKPAKASKPRRTREGDEADVVSTDAAADEPAEDATEEEPTEAGPEPEPQPGALRNKRPTGKTRHRLRR